MSEAIITDVTRMRPPKVCIAAIQGTRAIRLEPPQPDERVLASIGGLLPGDRSRRSNGTTTRFTSRPTSKTACGSRRSLRKLGRLTKADLVGVLMPGAARSVEEAFGPEWFRGGQGNGAFRPGVGERSLASVLVRDVRVYQWFQSVRVDFTDDGGAWTMVPLEDLLVRRHQVLCARMYDESWPRLGLRREPPQGVLRPRRSAAHWTDTPVRGRRAGNGVLAPGHRRVSHR